MDVQKRDAYERRVNGMGFYYTDAPIREALIDIRVEAPASSLEHLENLQETIKQDYPRKKAHFFFEGEISAGERISASARQKPTGFAFESADGKQIFEARIDGVTVFRLKPYTKWVDIRDEAKRLWELYRTVAPNSRVTRVAVRYINQIEIPKVDVDYKDYFLTSPEVSSALPQGLAGFFMQLRFTQTDFGGMVILTQAAVPPPSPNVSSVILDVDVFKESPALDSDVELWPLLELLRGRKNDFFEGCLTDRSRALFGERVSYADTDS